MYESNLNESNNNSSDWLLLFKKKIGYNYFIRVRIVETKETTDDLQEEKSRDDMENELDGSSVLNNAEDDFHDLMKIIHYSLRELVIQKMGRSEIEGFIEKILEANMDYLNYKEFLKVMNRHYLGININLYPKIETRLEGGL